MGAKTHGMTKGAKPPIFDGYQKYLVARNNRAAKNYLPDSCANPHLAIDRVRVTLVTVVRNGGHTLRRTIESCLTQNYGDIEYIIIDGGSTDNTLDIIREYDKQITQWISEPDLGISDAFNKGLALATGEIVGFINADDWLEPEAIEFVVSQINSVDKATIVHGMIQYWSGDKRGYIVAGSHAFLKKDMTINHPTVFATAECYRSFGLFRLDFRFAMDYEWLLRASVCGAHFVYLPKVLVNMQLGGASDKKWHLAIWEVAKAKRLHQLGWLSSTSYYSLQLLKGGIRRLLEVFGFGFIVRYYRSRFSLVEKLRS